MEAVKLKRVDMDYRNHLQAWLTFAAKATNKKGKPVYKKFSKFYDYEKEIEKLKSNSEKKSRFSGIGKFLKRGG